MDKQIKKPTKTRAKQRVSVPGSRKQLLKLTVAEEGTLLPFLIASLSDKSRTTIKQLLHDRFISVNGEPTTQFDTPLKGGMSSAFIPTLCLVGSYTHRSTSSTKMST